MKISAIVLVGGKTNKELLKKCLDSISWCDEVVKVETTSLKGSFADWRNVGAKRAKGQWLLYVDSDEEITKELEKEIIQLINNSNHANAYAIPRKNFIFGKEFHHGGQWPDYVKRLFFESKFKGWRGQLHEEPIFEGEMAHLKYPLIHSKHKSLEEMVEKTNEWSEIEAKLIFEAGHPKMNVFRFFTAGFREFWLRMIKQMAFLDGIEGVIYAIYQVFSRLISYSKLWEMQIKA